MSRIAIAADHGGVQYKERIAALLRERGHEVVDFGTGSTDACDYPDVAHPAAEAVANGEAELGIVVCGSGIGVSIVANKSRGVRAANCTSPEMARLAREHNDANVLTIGERLVDWSTAREIVDVFLSTEASTDERHRRRVDKINAINGL